MPLDATGYLSPRVLTPDEARELAILKAARHRIRRLAAHLPPGWDAIHLYNDHRSTTHADILSLYDRAIAELE